ncbi:MAG: aspartyl/asparaginyl beta-hydroxylase domain-containing protein [Pseudomonadota bacterium]
MSTPDPIAALLSRNRFADAEALCRARLQTDPADAAALGALLPMLFRRGELLQARLLAEQAAHARPGRRDLLLMLGQVRERMRDFGPARAAYANASALDADEWIAPLMLGDCAEAEGDAEAALAARAGALGRAERAGALAPGANVPAAVQPRLQRAIAEVQRGRGRFLDAALARFREVDGEAASPRVGDAIDALLGRRPRAQPHPLQYPTLLCVPDLPPQPWFEREDFPFLAEIERETDAIRAELLALLDDDDTAGMQPYIDMPTQAPAAPIWRELNRSPRWRGYHFHRHGEAVEAHRARCPRTAAALDRLPLMRIPGHAPEAMFSLLAPRTAIPPHTGVMNGRLTVHLPLIVPEDCGALRAGEEARPWQEGRCIVFDDSFVHEAWNRSDHLRAVLIFDIWHPGLDAIEREALTAAIVALGAFNRRYAPEQ